MALRPIQIKPKESGGKGGLFGTIAGTVLGAAAAPFTGGASVALGPLGGAVGGLADPAKQSGGRGVPLSTMAQQDPQVKLAQLMKASEDIRKSALFSEPEKQELFSTITPAIDALRRSV